MREPLCLGSEVPLILPLHALRPAAEVALPWEPLVLIGVPFLLLLGCIALCRDVKRERRNQPR